jgi:broad specificity phosphatase PhoE
MARTRRPGNPASKASMQVFARGLVAWILCLVAALAVTGARAQGTPDAAHALAGPALAAALKQGGFVIYFRHADTGPAVPEPPGFDLARCETQRNLNDDGREQAREIGAQFRRLELPVGGVLSSEFCRCWQTAELAFGRYEKTSDLTGVPRGPQWDDLRAQRSAALRRLLSSSPAAGQNSVLVSHGFNLWDLERFHLGTQGEAAVYRPDGRGAYTLVARLLPEDWARLR